MTPTFRTSYFAMLERHIPQLLAGPASRVPSTHAVNRSPGAVSIVGVLGSTADWYADSTYEGIRQQVRRAAADAQARTIDLFVDSPGGSVLGLPETAQVIAEANRTKPVRAFVTGNAASAAYWLVAQASTISLTPSGEVGSVGVLDIHADVSTALENTGVKITAVTAGEFKTERAPFTPLSDSAKAHMQSGVDAWYQDFLGAIRKGRGARVSAASKFGDGRMLSSKEALAAGMVDFVGVIL